MRESVSKSETRTAWALAGMTVLFAFVKSVYLSEFSILLPQVSPTLPLHTRAMLAFGNWIPLLGIPAILGAYALSLGRRRIGWWSIGASAGVSLLLVPVIVSAMYAPVLQ